jgi:peptidoglycan LD-endopeptidase CwlK
MYLLKESFLKKLLGVLFGLILFSFPRVSLANVNNLNPTIQFNSTGRYVKLLQMDLDGLDHNFNNFGVDGIYGIKTQQSVGNYQDEFELPRDGIVDAATWKVLTDDVIAVQKRLNSLGYNVGHADGSFSEMTIKALKRFQRANMLYPDGVVNPRTRRKLFNPHPKDKVEYQPTSNSISSLNSYVAKLARKFIDLAKANNLDVRILTTFRSWNEQDKLYAQGRNAPGEIIRFFCFYPEDPRGSADPRDSRTPGGPITR